MKNILIVLSFGIFSQLLAGCAYHFGPNHRQLPAGAKTVYIKMFENRTQEVGIESDFTNSFIQELARSGVATVDSQASADLTIAGIIHTVDYLGKTSVGMPDQFQNPAILFTEYQTRITIVVTAIDRNKVDVWQGQFAGEKNYKAPQLTTPGLSTSNPLYNQSARRNTIRSISKEMAAESISRLTENF